MATSEAHAWSSMWTGCSGGGRSAVCWAGSGPCAGPRCEIAVRCWPCLASSGPFQLTSAMRRCLVTDFRVLVARPIMKLLRRDGYPPGALLPTGRSLVPRWVFGGSKTRKLAGLEEPRRADAGRRDGCSSGMTAGMTRRCSAISRAATGAGFAVMALRQVFDAEQAKISSRLRAGTPSVRRWSGRR